MMTVFVNASPEHPPPSMQDTERTTSVATATSTMEFKTIWIPESIDM